MVIYFQKREQSKATKKLCSHLTMLEKGSFLDCIQNTQKSLLFQGWNKIEKKHLKGCISGNPFSACQTKPKGLSHNLLSNNSFDDDVMMVSN